MEIPDPALVVLVGPAGSGKSHWAARHYRAEEIVSADQLRAVVGSGPADLDASTDAFALLDSIVAARAGRGLTVVVDTLGLDRDRRAGYLPWLAGWGCRRSWSAWTRQPMRRGRGTHSATGPSPRRCWPGSSSGCGR